MIDQTFIHLPGVGPVTDAKLKRLGFTDWRSVLERPDDLPLSPQNRDLAVRQLQRSLEALDQDDLSYLMATIDRREQWRILHRYGDRASYFDIETDGLGHDALVTVAACRHRGQVHHFVQGENFDDFLDLLDDVDLLVSFNGNCFDVPMLLRAWHIPELPCPHLDLRWLCHHCGLKGGLKQIEVQLGMQRPDHLHGVDGAEAVYLWYLWYYRKDTDARQRLIDYCAADVVSLPKIAELILQRYERQA